MFCCRDMLKQREGDFAKCIVRHSALLGVVAGNMFVVALKRAYAHARDGRSSGAQDARECFSAREPRAARARMPSSFFYARAGRRGVGDESPEVEVESSGVIITLEFCCRRRQHPETNGRSKRLPVCRDRIYAQSTRTQ